jgi:AraC-like DNA-binding protein
LQRISYPVMQVELCTAGQGTVKYRVGRQAHKCIVHPGSLFIYPGWTELTDLQVSGASRFVLVQLEGPLIRRAHRRDTFGTEDIVPQHNIRNARIAALVEAMQDEIRLGCPADRLYAESLSLALSSYIASRFSVTTHGSQRQSGGQMSSPNLRRVLDYIHSSLEHDLSLLELASLVRLSPRHFAQLFKNTLGVTPHAYVLQARVDRAKRLLASPLSSISEVALSLGFGSQSYFTQVFRQVTGTTPKHYQREHQKKRSEPLHLSTGKNPQQGRRYRLRHRRKDYG